MKFKSLTALFVLFVHLSALAADVQGIVSCPEMQKPVKPGNSCCCGIEEAPDESRAGIPEFTRSKCNTSQSQDVNAIIYFGNERKEEQKQTSSNIVCYCNSSSEDRSRNNNCPTNELIFNSTQKIFLLYSTFRC